MRDDWRRLVNALLVGTAPLLKVSSDEDSVEAMGLRIASTALKTGAQGLAWATQSTMGAGLGNSKSKKLVAALGLGGLDPNQLPPELERAATVFLAAATAQVSVVDGQRTLVDSTDPSAAPPIDEERRDRATIAAFYAFIRVVADLRDELGLAAQSSKHVQPLPTAIEKALAEIGVRAIAPASGAMPDLASCRVAGYEDGDTPGTIARVRKPGLEYRNEILRKAEVTAVRAPKPPSAPAVTE